MQATVFLKYQLVGCSSWRLKKTDTKLITKLKIVTEVAYIGFSVAIAFVQSTQLRVYVVSKMLVTTLQASTVIVAAWIFLFRFPWKDLLEEIKERDLEDVENLVRDPENRNIAD